MKSTDTHSPLPFSLSLLKKSPSHQPRRIRKRDSQLVNFVASSPLCEERNRNKNLGGFGARTGTVQRGPRILERASEFESLIKDNYDTKNIQNFQQNMFMEAYQKGLDAYKEKDFKKVHQNAISQIQSLNPSPKKQKKKKNSSGPFKDKGRLSLNVIDKRFNVAKNSLQKPKMKKIQSQPMIKVHQDPGDIKLKIPKKEENKSRNDGSRILKQFSRPRNHAAINKMIKGLYQGLKNSPELKLKLLHNKSKVMKRRQRRHISVERVQANQISQVNPQVKSRNINVMKTLNLKALKLPYASKIFQ
ncbi:unnamed protein product [Moneuplotes crassus]|uniref:Uncharacterized protein n=1 Tax=Euplotes crassus TaxID=5936 RepID=A0AAD1XEI1_EUPCR|nr:unnamed protein product [Moneuplotes crassus]